MRLFIAIDFPEPLKKQIAAIGQDLQRQMISGRLTTSDNLHLTLVFIGETNRLSDVKQVLSTVKAAPFILKFGDVGRFRRDGGDIYWYGVQNDPTLQKLYHDLDSGLRQAGFALESRPYRPHLTLGRQMTMQEAFDLRVFAGSALGLQTEVAEVCLMKSQRIANRQVYTKIAVQPLVG